MTSNASVTINDRVTSTNPDNRVQISGALTVETVASLTGAATQTSGQTDLVIDMQQVEAVDSAAVSLMLLWLREAQRNKVNLCFAHVPENLLSLARLYDVAELLPLCQSNTP